MKKKLKKTFYKLFKYSYWPRPWIEITIFLYFFVAVIFIIIGGIKLHQSINLNEFRYWYDNLEKCSIG